jgi:hypothetical protein
LLRYRDIDAVHIVVPSTRYIAAWTDDRISPDRNGISGGRLNDGLRTNTDTIAQRYVAVLAGQHDPMSQHDIIADDQGGIQLGVSTIKDTGITDYYAFTQVNSARMHELYTRPKDGTLAARGE